MLTFFLDRLFSNRVKMIKVGIIRTRTVITAFLSFALGPPRRSEIYIWPGALFPHFLGLAGNGRAIELEARARLPPRLTPFDRRFGDTLALLRACCGRFRIQAGVASGSEPGSEPWARARPGQTCRTGSRGSAVIAGPTHRSLCSVVCEVCRLDLQGRPSTSRTCFGITMPA
jgi:hypothetical protein